MGHSRSLETEPLDRSYTTSYVVVELFDVEYYCDLEIWLRGHSKVIEFGAIQKLGYGFLFAFYSNYGFIFSHFGDIQRQRMT